MKRAKRISAFYCCRSFDCDFVYRLRHGKRQIGRFAKHFRTNNSGTKHRCAANNGGGNNNRGGKTSSSIEIEIGGNSFSLGGSSSGNSGSSASGGYESEVLYCKNGSEKLYGEMYTPDNYSGKLPVVILAHSYMLNGSSLSAYAEMFAENGYAAYIFDFWGGSSSTRSGGSTSDMTLYTEISDLKAVLSEIRKLDYIDSSSVFLLGTSLGGCVAAMTANDKASQISGLIYFIPRLSIRNRLRSGRKWAHGSA